MARRQQPEGEAVTYRVAAAAHKHHLGGCSIPRYYVCVRPTKTRLRTTTSALGCSGDKNN